MSDETNRPAYRMFFSDRGLPLVLCQAPVFMPTLTVENYCKWYRLYLVHPDGRVAPVDFPEWAEGVDDGQAAYVDHVPNPNAVVAWANRSGYAVDSQSHEMMVGRWEMEVMDNWGDE